ncbi:endonuclease/Exonuclease/phosphatase family protein [bacterium BMS3Bbin04]|nr:endonuclease/Exonuclease/phosphatase family protein [bacterium BMS3Bbin04]
MATATLAILVIVPYLGISLLDPLQALAGQQILRIVLIPVILLQLMHWLYAERNIEVLISAAMVFILLFETLHSFPLQADEPDSPPTMRVITHNCQGQGTGGWLSWINQEGADLACIQEVPPSEREYIQRIGERHGFHDQLIVYAGNPSAGISLLSRFPFAYIDSLLIPELDDSHRYLPVAGILVDGDTVDVIGVHLASARGRAELNIVGSAWTVRKKQAEIITEWVRENEGPCIVIGDFNSTPTDRVMRGLRAELDDMWEVSGSGFGATWPAGLPFLRIDQVYTRGFAGMSDPVFKAIAASDHLALSMTLHGDDD